MFYERRCYRSLYSLHFFVSLLFRFVAAAAAAAAAAVVAVAAVVVSASGDRARTAIRQRPAISGRPRWPPNPARHSFVFFFFAPYLVGSMIHRIGTESAATSITGFY